MTKQSKSDETIDLPATESTTHSPEPINSTIGPYRLVQVIGEGGMGTVYMAQQEQQIRRRVALKIIKLGMDTKQVVARFAAERQALSMMEHPNIARTGRGNHGSRAPLFRDGVGPRAPDHDLL